MKNVEKFELTKKVNALLENNETCHYVIIFAEFDVDQKSQQLTIGCNFPSSLNNEVLTAVRTGVERIECKILLPKGDMLDSTEKLVELYDIFKNGDKEHMEKILLKKNIKEIEDILELSDDDYQNLLQELKNERSQNQSEDGLFRE